MEGVLKKKLQISRSVRAHSSHTGGSEGGNGERRAPE